MMHCAAAAAGAVSFRSLVVDLLSDTVTLSSPSLKPVGNPPCAAAALTQTGRMMSSRLALRAAAAVPTCARCATTAASAAIPSGGHIVEEESDSLGRHRSALLSTGVRLHWAEAGEASAPPLLLLHGFPDMHCTWRKQLPALAAAGFRAIAPDLRGYGRSSSPLGVAAYGAAEVVADCVALAAVLGVPSYHAVVGHDWGANVAWHIAAREPGLVQRLAILNVPHPTVFWRTVSRSLSQIRKSWYIAFFQLPFVPERFMASQDNRALRTMLATDANETVPANIVEQHVALFSRPGAWSGPLNFYRAGLSRGLWSLPARRIVCPVSVIWGERDPYLESSMAAPPPELVPHATVLRLPKATHWVHWDEPEAVNAALLELLARPVGASH